MCGEKNNTPKNSVLLEERIQVIKKQSLHVLLKMSIF